MIPDLTVLTQLDERIRTDFESTRDYFFQGLLWATVAVLVGVLLEGPEVIHQIQRQTRIFPGSSALSSKVAPTVLTSGGDIRSWLSFIGWFVLIVGLCGEGAFEVLVSKADGALQRFNEILIASAITDAATANERAAENAKEAARLTSENLKLRTYIQPRSLTPEQQSQIGSRLRHLAGESVRVDSFAIDPEAYQLCEQIAAAFTLAHLEVSDMCGVFPINARDVKLSGIFITSWKKDDAAEAIRKALSTIPQLTPVSVTNIKQSSQPEPYLTVGVATKPLSVLK